MITSLSNSKIKHLVELQLKSKTRNKEGIFVAEGLRIFEEAPINLIKEIYVEEGTYTRMMESGVAPSSHLNKSFLKLSKCQKAGIEIETVWSDVFRKASGTDSPQGIIFTVKKPSYDLGSMLRNYPEGTKGNILILEDIQDPGNLGTMMRTAEAAGMAGIVLSKGCVDVYNPKTVRSTMGGIFRVPHVYVESLDSAVELLKQSGVTIYATDLDADGEYDSFDYSGRSGILIGNEGNGLSEEMIKKSDVRVIIPMFGEIESLNASIAAALMMYQAR